MVKRAFSFYLLVLPLYSGSSSRVLVIKPTKIDPKKAKEMADQMISGVTSNIRSLTINLAVYLISSIGSGASSLSREVNVSLSYYYLVGSPRNKKIMAPQTDKTAKITNKVDCFWPVPSTTPAVILPRIWVDMKKAQKVELKTP